jgi:hypothetical protein
METAACNNFGGNYKSGVELSSSSPGRASARSGFFMRPRAVLALLLFGIDRVGAADR